MEQKQTIAQTHGKYNLLIELDTAFGKTKQSNKGASKTLPCWKALK